MSSIGNRLEAIKYIFQTAMPGRIFTRRFVYRDQLKDADLRKGVCCFISAGVSGFNSPIERELMEGQHRFLLSAQIVIKDGEPEQVEEAELLLFDEVKNALIDNKGNPTICPIDLIDFKQSGQTDAPYGWALFEFEYSYS